MSEEKYVVRFENDAGVMTVFFETFIVARMFKMPDETWNVGVFWDVPMEKNFATKDKAGVETIGVFTGDVPGKYEFQRDTSKGRIFYTSVRLATQDEVNKMRASGRL
jgi:hypothetical protein